MTEPNTQQPSFFESTPVENPCFIETQFPVSKISAESYKERKAGNGQTLTGIGKWWGRKPLILVRTALLGLLLPASANPEKDREVFLKLLTMDHEGLLKRKSKPISQDRITEELAKMPPGIQKKYSLSQSKLSKVEKDELQHLIFDRLPYSEKLEYCDRPEQIDGPSLESWAEINAHLSTNAQSLPELVQELGDRRFGHRPRVGDSFCGGGSIPFESARIGFDIYGSDLNPIASLLTWASVNIIGGDSNIESQVTQAIENVYEEVDREISDSGIEQNSIGWRADVFLYCMEVKDPETGWRIPLLPTFVIAETKNIVVKLVPDYKSKRYDFLIEQINSDEVKSAKESYTVKNSRVYPPDGSQSIPIDIFRQKIRQWNFNDITAKDSDTFQDRLYCIRWVETFQDEKGNYHERKIYRAPTIEDLKREDLVAEIVRMKIPDWQDKGIFPIQKINRDSKSYEPLRKRGWNYWHHLFNPRQILVLGLLSEKSMKVINPEGRIACMLGINRSADWNSKLSRWDPTPGKEFVVQTFWNQAFNTLYNYGARGLTYLKSSFALRYVPSKADSKINSQITVEDARKIQTSCDYWMTDPPYADAVNYHELSEFFLSWQQKQIPRVFPSWYTDTRSALAITGKTESFRKSMIESYKNLSFHMPDNGMQIVMFTHQDASVWADLTMILWAAGLRVTAAWTIATETDAVGIKKGNNVQGTVLLVLRKRNNSAPLFLDEISHQVEDEVRRQLDSMTRLEDASDPNFGDADYQLAAYAAALRVLTGQPIEEIDPEKEILRERKPGEVGPVEALIRRAVKIACDHLIPRNLNPELWKSLGSMERFYIKGLEVESHGEYRSGVYQELARGFGANDYTDLLESTKANETRLKTAFEFGKKGLGTFGNSGEAFDDSLVRQCLFSIWLTVKNEGTKEGMDYLHTELREAYWSNREKITGVLEYLVALGHSSTMEHWHKDAHAASLLAGAVRNDHV